MYPSTYIVFQLKTKIRAQVRTRPLLKGLMLDSNDFDSKCFDLKCFDLKCFDSKCFDSNDFHSNNFILMFDSYVD